MPENALFRDATEADVPALATLRNQSTTPHANRVRDARGGHLAYLAVEVSDQLVGHGLVVLRQPPSWPTMKHLPQLIDLWIRPDLRGHGLGQGLINTLEARATQAGCTEIYLGVNPTANAPARALYQRLGYKDLDPEPVPDKWEVIDADGVTHSGTEWIIHMRKELIQS